MSAYVVLLSYPGIQSLYEQMAFFTVEQGSRLGTPCVLLFVCVFLLAISVSVSVPRCII